MVIEEVNGIRCMSEIVVLVSMLAHSAVTVISRVVGVTLRVACARTPHIYISTTFTQLHSMQSVIIAS